MQSAQDDLLTTREAAAVLDLSVWGVRYHQRRGRLEIVRNGLGHVRYVRDSVLAFKEQRETYQ